MQILLSYSKRNLAMIHYRFRFNMRNWFVKFKTVDNTQLYKNNFQMDFFHKSLIVSYTLKISFSSQNCACQFNSINRVLHKFYLVKSKFQLVNKTHAHRQRPIRKKSSTKCSLFNVQCILNIVYLSILYIQFCRALYSCISVCLSVCLFVLYRLKNY